MLLRTVLLFTWLLMLPGIAVSAAPPQGVDLAAIDGWDIVVDSGATLSETYAAEEFRDFLAKVSGHQLPIVKQTDRADRHVFIGVSEPMRSSNVGFATDSFGTEDLRIVIRDNNIAIAGGRPRGTLYGVYTFLEDYLGVRFLTHDHTYTPPLAKWRVVGPVDRFYHPPLSFRWSYYGETNGNPAFAARMRCNTVTHDGPLGGVTPTVTHDGPLGGITSTVLIIHSFCNLIPSSKYGAEHPEYYCLIDGKRRAKVPNDNDDGGQGNQPCLSNPDVQRIITQAVLKEIERHPQRGNVSVTQNDNDKYCRCPTCASVDEREGTPMGSLLTLVNAVAEQVASTHPDVKVGTLAYWYSRHPPKTIKPRPNVMIQLASGECSVTRPINDPTSKLNVSFCRDLEDWGRISNHINIWTYNTNFSNYLLPCPNLRVIEPNIRFFVANQAKGIFMQGAGDALGAEFSDLRNYVTSRLLWNPNLRGEQLIDEFLTLHYGRAAPPIREFINLVHDNAMDKGIDRNCYGSAKDFGIDATIVQAGLTAFDQALRLADDAQVRSRVAKASICAYRAAMEDAWLWTTNNQGQLGQMMIPSDIARRTRPHMSRLFELCDNYGVNLWAEGVPVQDVQNMLKQAFQLDEDESF